MKVKAGQVVLVQDPRKVPREYKARAVKDFDTEADDWYPLETLEYIEGLVKWWAPGAYIPARRGINTIVEILEATS